MTESRAGVILDIAERRADGRTFRTLIGSLGDLGFLVKRLPSNGGQGSWRLFDSERNLANHLRAMALAEAEVQRVLRVIGSEGRVVLEDDGDAPRFARPEAPTWATRSR